MKGTLLPLGALMVVLAQSASGAELLSSAQIVVEPKPRAGLLLNPGKGWSAGGLPERHAPEVLELLGMGVMRLDWASIEPREGEFNWSILDRFLGSWGKLGSLQRGCNVRQHTWP